MNMLQLLFGLMILLDALRAYTVLGVPIPWFSYACALIGLILVVKKTDMRIRIPPASSIVFLLIGYALVVQLLNTGMGHSYSMPSKATTGYWMFITARFGTLGGFFIVLTFTYNVARRIGTDKLMGIVSAIAVFVIAAALYIYAAQTLGLWEPPRNRLGTGGQDFLSTPVRFTYAFHRLLGTFREPSHFAEWIVGPLLILWFLPRTVYHRIVTILGFVALALTGSLLGALELLAALSIVVVARLLSGRVPKRLLWVPLSIVFGVLTATFVTGVDVLGVVTHRLSVLFREGVGGTNRAYVYDYLRSNAPPIMGYGLGNANLVFSEYRGSDLVQSHLSLYVNYWFSLGIVGLVLVSLISLRPFLSRRMWWAANRDQVTVVLLAGIMSWLVSFLGNAEELSVMFATLCGLAWARVNELETGVNGNDRQVIPRWRRHFHTGSPEV